MPDPAQQPERGRVYAEYVDQPLQQDLQLGRPGGRGVHVRAQLAPDPVRDADDHVVVAAEAPYGAIGVTARSDASRCIVRGVRPGGAGERAAPPERRGTQQAVSTACTAEADLASGALLVNRSPAGR